MKNATTNTTGNPSNFTMDELLKVMASIPPMPPDPLRDMLGYFGPVGHHRMAGFDVFESPVLDKQPKFQLMQATVDVMSAEKAAEINAWLADFFGWHEAQQYMCGPRLFVGLKVARDLRGIVNYNVA